MDYQHGPVGAMDDSPGDTSKQDRANARQAAGAHYNRRCILLVGDF
jgi:hypothetical protein